MKIQFKKNFRKNVAFRVSFLWVEWRGRSTTRVGENHDFWYQRRMFNRSQTVQGGWWQRLRGSCRGKKCLAFPSIYSMECQWRLQCTHLSTHRYTHARSHSSLPPHKHMQTVTECLFIDLPLCHYKSVTCGHYLSADKSFTDILQRSSFRQWKWKVPGNGE